MKELLFILQATQLYIISKTTLYQEIKIYQNQVSYIT